ncbi:MAG: LON peptidase substrate-binding domain-containing protein [Acidobacteria bacterium]|nr:LON peptidase substrate-binding domain-containing protein [Acidobacteriota bacterium]
MSEAMDKTQGIDHLAIFPLPLVLLPNELLPLHIFEPRYREMLSDVRKGKNLFGINMFTEETNFDSRPEPGSVGCVAEIRDVQEMPDGRSNIVTSGLVRYRLLEYIDIGKPYLTAEVAFFEDDEQNNDVLTPLAEEVFILFGRIAKAAFKMSGNRGQLPEIPMAEPEQLSFLVTAAFNFDNELKYELLQTTSTIERLDRLKEILLRAVDEMEASADITKAAQTNGHSKKKLDI